MKLAYFAAGIGLLALISVTGWLVREHWASAIDAGLRDADRGALPTPRMVRRLLREYETHGVVWSSDSSKIAAYSNWGDLITVWAADGTVITEIQRHGDHDFSQSLAFTRKDTEIIGRPQFYTESDVAAAVYDVKTGAVDHRIEGPLPGKIRTPGNWMTELAASPDGSVFAAAFGSADRQPVGLYSTADWSRLVDIPYAAPLLSFDDEPLALAFSAGSKFLAIALPFDIFVYDIAARRVVTRLAGYDAVAGGCCIAAIAINPDASFVAVGSGAAPGRGCVGNLASATWCRNSKPVQSLRVIRVKDGAAVAHYSDPIGRVWAMKWSPDGRFIAFLLNNALHLWDPTHPQEERRIAIDDVSTSLAFSPDGRYLAVCQGRSVLVFDITQ